MAKKQKSKTSWKKVLGIIAGVLAVLLVVGLFVYNKLGDNGTFGRYTYSVKSEHRKVSNNMMSYFLTTSYQQYYSSYSYYINQGVDQTSESSTSSSAPSLSELKTRQCSLGSSDPDVRTWYDYFLLEIAVPQVKNMLVLAEAADAAGYGLTDDDKAQIDEAIDNYKTTAQSYGYSNGNEFVMFGAGVREKDVRAAMELSTLASSYSKSLSDGFTYTEDDYNAYLEEHKDEFRYVDFVSFTLKGDDLIPEETEDDTAEAVDSDVETEADTDADTDAETVADTDAETVADTDAESADADTEEDDEAKAEYYQIAKEGAEKIAEAKSEDEFRAAVEEYLRTVLYKDLKLPEQDEKVKSDLEGITTQSRVFSSSDELTGKLFEAEANAAVIDDSAAENGNYTVYLVTGPDHLEEYKTKNAYVILIEAEETTLPVDEDAEPVKITDRAVENGDSVNIDYVGSVDGVEFEGGSTQGNGTDVTAGGTGYIDDFLTQIIGHKPGETFDVNVTFPDEYPNNPDLAGKDAKFVTTINYITEEVEPETVDNSLDTVKSVQDALAADSSAENFAKLAKEYSTGAADAYYKNITKNYFGDEALDEWLFDDARKVGDRSSFDISVNENGTEHVHHVIIQFAGDGLTKWQYDADNKLRSADLTAKSEEFDAAYGGDKITVDKEKLYKIG